MRILIVEDSETLLEALSRSLKQEGYACDLASDGVSALQYLDSYRYDAVILDLMMPRLDGYGVLKRLGQRDGSSPVLVLSARDQVDDRVKALDAGADDFLTKPFELAELLARLRALARRPSQRNTPVLRLNALEVDPRSKTARLAGTDLTLTPKEYRLLELLMRHQGRVLSREQIFEHLYDSQSDASDKVVEVIISTLRNKLAQHEIENLILTRRGFGYVIP
ncbi:MAG: response regulator transcription factor [Pusillimonas sp.]|jgi:DNA-binding response OmpR family regulator|nr:response regulator transcription factor [Pusillimonas sp.]